MGPQDVIAKVLQADTTDGPAASVWAAAYPQMFSIAGDVPAWLTTSLQTLLNLNSGDTLARSIISLPGLSANKQTADIEINLISYDSAEKTDGWHADIVGGETAAIRILCRQPRTTAATQVSVIENLSQRIRFLLDTGVRGTRGSMLSPLQTLPAGQGSGLPIPFGTGIDPTEPFFCYFLGSNNEQTTIEWTSVFRCEYVRIFGALA